MKDKMPGKSASAQPPTLKTAPSSLYQEHLPTPSPTLHSYHITFDTSADTTTRKGTGATLIQFADGTIAKALHDYNENGVDGSVWGQNVGIDTYPVLSGKITYTTLSSSSMAKSSSSEKTTLAPTDYVLNNIRIETIGNTLIVKNFAGNVSVFDLNGNLIQDIHSNGQTEFRLPRAGSYIVKAGANSRIARIKH